MSRNYYKQWATVNGKSAGGRGGGGGGGCPVGGFDRLRFCLGKVCPNTVI